MIQHTKGGYYGWLMVQNLSNFFKRSLFTGQFGADTLICLIASSQAICMVAVFSSLHLVVRIWEWNTNVLFSPNGDFNTDKTTENYVNKQHVFSHCISLKKKSYCGHANKHAQKLISVVYTKNNNNCWLPDTFLSLLQKDKCIKKWKLWIHG